MIPTLFNLDFYKTCHHKQYLPGTSRIVSNLTPRSSRIPGIDKIVWFGVANLLLNLQEEFENSVDYDNFNPMYPEIVGNALGVDKDELRIHIGRLADFVHRYGHLPVEIRALPEGAVVPLRVPCLTIHNTDPKFAWLPNFLETHISNSLWQASTSATLARAYRETFDKYARETGSPLEFCDWQGHDFSARGMAGADAAALSGLGHLTSFMGTDTVSALWLGNQIYGQTPAGGSVPATEHSVMCAAGESGEVEVLEHLLKTYPHGIVSVVSDSFDFWAFVKLLCTTYKQKLLDRNGKFVVRPDSGDPVKILVGDSTSTDPMARKGLIEVLWDAFGGVVSATGHRILDSHIGAIYGDSITLERQKLILEGLKNKGFASCNVVLGIGSYTYQYTTRDTFGWAIKATYMERDGKAYNIFKRPKTDDGTKFSAKGLPFVTRENGQYKLIEGVSWDKFVSAENALQPVEIAEDFEEIRLRLKKEPSIFSS